MHQCQRFKGGGWSISRHEVLAYRPSSVTSEAVAHCAHCRPSPPSPDSLPSLTCLSAHSSQPMYSLPLCFDILACSVLLLNGLSSIDLVTAASMTGFQIFRHAARRLACPPSRLSRVSHAAPHKIAHGQSRIHLPFFLNAELESRAIRSTCTLLPSFLPMTQSTPCIPTLDPPPAACLDLPPLSAQREGDSPS